MPTSKRVRPTTTASTTADRRAVWVLRPQHPIAAVDRRGRVRVGRGRRTRRTVVSGCNRDVAPAPVGRSEVSPDTTWCHGTIRGHRRATPGPPPSPGGTERGSAGARRTAVTSATRSSASWKSSISNGRSIFDSPRHQHGAAVLGTVVRPVVWRAARAQPPRGVRVGRCVDWTSLAPVTTVDHTRRGAVERAEPDTQRTAAVERGPPTTLSEGASPSDPTAPVSLVASKGGTKPSETR